jgi:glycosyltransferase involved in cell wall biosynthesis
VRVVIADPPAYTPWYDHELAEALARAGADVELATSHFRFAELPAPEGYVRAERFYPLSSRLFRRSRARFPLKAAEHLGVARSLARVRADVLHLQWLALPQVDVNIKFKSPAVFTAHDLLPRRTADKLALWKRLLEKFDRVLVHTERGREALGELGIEPTVISHPVYPSSAERDDDGQTILALGVIRPYKGLADAVEVVTRLTDSRLLVAGDPAMELGDLRDAPRTEWRLGYLTPAELDRALSNATIAIFPYRAELDQSGALLQALGAGVPAVAYDVGGLAEPIARYGAGRIVPAGDVDALTQAAASLLSDAQALAAARDGAERARAELTWDAAAARHLELYQELG